MIFHFLFFTFLCVFFFFDNKKKKTKKKKTIMFFCNAQYSPKTYNKKFGELTEAIFIKELREFFYELFKDVYYKTVELELCEEYIKE